MRKPAKTMHATIDMARDGLDQTDLAKHAKELHQALERALLHPSSVDGYKATVTGADQARARGSKPTVTDENGNEVTVDLTTVEAAAIRPNRTDEHDRLVLSAIDYFDEAERALRASINKLRQLEQLRADRDTGEGEPGCWALSRIGAWEPVFARTEIDGDVRPLGRWAYDFVRSTGHLPTIDECKRHMRGQKVRRKVA